MRNDTGRTHASPPVTDLEHTLRHSSRHTTKHRSDNKARKHGSKTWFENMVRKQGSKTRFENKAFIRCSQLANRAIIIALRPSPDWMRGSACRHHEVESRCAWVGICRGGL